MKISDYELYRMPWDLVDFKDEVVTIINYGKYAFMVTNGLPTFLAGEGEQLMYMNGTDRRFYIYMGGAWNWVRWGGGGTGLSTDTWWIHDANSDTYVTTEGTSGSGNEDVIRFSVGDSQGGVAGEKVTVDSTGLSVISDLRIGLEGRGGNTFWKYNSGTEYIEAWVNNIKRLEM